jgi:hypothetical protein
LRLSGKEGPGSISACFPAILCLATRKEKANMEEKEKEKEPGTVSRRDFLKDAGLAVGGAVVGAAAGAGITYAVAPREVVKEVPVTKEVTVTKEVQVPVTGVLEPASEPEETRCMVLSF